MDHSRPRPQMPGITQSPAVMGRKSAYSGSNLIPIPHSEESFSERALQPTLKTHLRSQEKLIQKLLVGLPHDIRERVSAAINLTMQQADLATKDLELSHVEVVTLRASMKQKDVATERLNKICESYRQKIQELEEKLDDMKDGMESRQKFVVKNRRAVIRMASTNRMLIESLDALQTSQAPEVPISEDNFALNSPSQKQQSNPQSDHLRDSLLRVSREQFRSVKKIELMEHKMEELKTNLKAAEQRNRQLKLEVDELRSHQDVAVVDEKNIMDNIKDGLVVKSKSFGKIDERFKALLARQALDPAEGLMTLRRLLAYMALSPGNLNLVDICEHICSREVMKVFDVEMVCLYLVSPDDPNVVHKYTSRSRNPDVISLEFQSVVQDVLRLRAPARYNSLTRVDAFHLDIDGCPGVVTKRICSVPLVHPTSDSVIGAVHLLNRNQTSGIFSEVDELFAMVYADQAATLLASCLVHESMSSRANLLTHLLEASVGLYHVVPESGSFNADKPLSPAEILFAVESVVQEAVQCVKVRAFLATGQVGLEPGGLIMLEKSRRGRGGNKRRLNMPTKIVSDSSGLAGLCVHSRRPREGQGSDLDAYVNSEVDIDPLGLPMVAIPIISPNGTVLGCLEIVAGPNSPKFYVGDTAPTSEDPISFQQATEWLSHQLNAALLYLLTFMGKTIERPMSTPSAIRKSGKALKLDTSAVDFVSVPFNAFAGDDASSSTGSGMFSPTRRPEATRQKGRTVETLAHLRQILDTMSVERLDNRSSPSTPLPAGGGGGGGSRRRTASRDGSAKAQIAFEDDDEYEVAEMPWELPLKKALAEAAQLEEDVVFARSELAAAKKSEEAARSELADVLQHHEQRSTGLNARITELISSEESLKAELAVLQQLLREAELRVEVSATEALAKLTALQDSHAQELRTHKENLEGAQGKSVEGLQGTIAEQATALHRLQEELAAVHFTAQAKLSSTEQLLALAIEEKQLMSDAVAAHSTTIKSLQDHLHVSTGSVQQLEAQFAKAVEETTTVRAAHDALQAQVLQLEIAIKQKETVTAILQEQVVKMAGANMKILDEAVQKTSESAAAATAAATAPVAAPYSAPSPASAAAPVAAPVSLPAPSVALATPSKSANQQLRPTTSGPPQTPPPHSRKPTTQLAGAIEGTTSAAGSAAGMSSSSVPHPWYEQVDAGGHKYYVNSVSGESSWEFPTSSHLPIATDNHFVHEPVQPLLVGDWLQQFDGSGNEYWVNQVTFESVWELPENAHGKGLGTALGAGGSLSGGSSIASASAGGYTIEL